MTTLYRTRIGLSGWEGAPGLNTIIWSKGTLTSVGAEEVANWHQDIANVFAVVDGYTCDNYLFTVQASVDVFDSITGEITGVITSSEGDITDGNGAGAISSMSRATQANVRLTTDVWENGRRLAGRMFFGPLNTEAFGEDGQLTTTAADAISDEFSLLNTGTGPRWAVYSRPKPTQPEGYYGDVVSIVCKRKPAVLRSRRD